MSAHSHTTLVSGCYRCDLNKDEMPSPLEAAVDADEAYMDEHNNTVNGDSEERVLGALAAALDAADLRQIANDVLKPYDPDLPDHLAEEIASDIRKKILGGTRG